ncbi:SEC12-like protein 2 [Aristolochia californica]|uniref:SEC12-like protein 2 n=1 Tax=Aristolochia californica TaxID=171875 RepID=UPI0035D9D623
MAIPACCKKYGLPLYCASWVPFDKIQQNSILQQEPKEETTREENSNEIKQSPSLIRYLVFGGGGGEGRSGVPNALLLAQFDFSTASLSDEPVNKLRTNEELPYRMAVHPGGEGLVCSFTQDCKWFEWDIPNSDESPKLALRSSEKLLTQLESVGLQLALSFNSEGSILAAGGEDGHLRVFKWPSMDIILDQADAHGSVKDLDFSSNGKFLVSLGNSGPCRVWDLISSVIVANLPRENDEIFGFCRFSQSSVNETLYITAMKGKHGGIISWNTTSWMRAGSKQLVRDPVSAFNISADGKLLALGTIEGDVIIVDSATKQVHTRVKKAHLGLVTVLTFSQDARALVSSSFDSSARVTVIENKKQNGYSMWLIFFIILLAIIAYITKDTEVLSYICPHMKKG